MILFMARMLLSLALLVYSYTETGIATVTILFLILFSLEIVKRILNKVSNDCSVIIETLDRRN